MSDLQKSIEGLKEEIRQGVRDFINQEMDVYIQKLVEGKFYQKLFLEMDSGIREMYQSINAFKKSLGEIKNASIPAEEIISDASDQLEEIVKTTEAATNEIMDLTERGQSNTDRIEEILAGLPPSAKITELCGIAAEMKKDFLSVMTSCSFQDLTGQRVRKVIELNKAMEEQVLALLVSSEIKVKGKKQGREESELDNTAQKAVQKLKGPDKASFDQQGVDDLLASLGL